MIGKSNAVTGYKTMGIPSVAYTLSDKLTKNGSSQRSTQLFHYEGKGPVTLPILNYLCTIYNFVPRVANYYVYYKKYSDGSPFLNLIKELLSEINLKGLPDGTYGLTLAFVANTSIVGGNPQRNMFADLGYPTKITISNGEVESCVYLNITSADDTSGEGRLYLTSFAQSAFI